MKGKTDRTGSKKITEGRDLETARVGDGGSFGVLGFRRLGWAKLCSSLDKGGQLTLGRNDSLWGLYNAYNINHVHVPNPTW